MKKLLLSAALLGLLLSPAAAAAQDGAASDSALISLGAGIWDVTQTDDTATDFRVEYRHGDRLFWKIKPWAGLEATSDGTLWGGGGILADFHIASNIYVTPSLGVGLYTDGDSDKDLGHPVEFRTQIEGGYEFMNGHRLGLAFSHLSNADLDDDNPGAEVLNLYYHIPLSGLQF